MRIFNKEISKRQVQLFIGGIAVAAIGTVAAVVIHNKEKDVIDVDYVELTEVEEPLELDSYREEEA